MILSSVTRPHNRIPVIQNSATKDDAKATIPSDVSAAKSSTLSQTTRFGDTSALRDAILARSSAANENTGSGDTQSVLQEKYSALSAGRNDHDVGSGAVSGELVNIETRGFFDFVLRPLEIVVDIVVDEVIEPAVDFVTDEIIEPAVDFVTDEVVEPVVEFVTDNVIKPIVDQVIKPVLDLLGDALVIGLDIVKFPIEVGQIVFNGAIDTGNALLSGDLSGAWGALTSTVGGVGAAFAAQVVDTAVLSASAAVNFIEELTGQINQRPLSQAEIASLQLIFGDSIDYSAVTIQTGGIKESLFPTAHVVGNTIFMPEDLFEADGVTLSDDGVFILNHEMGHIWQFQNRGPDYISSALYAQVTGGNGGVGTGEAYDWLAVANEGVHFNDMNPESQAELAAFIGDSIDRETGEIDELRLEAAIATALKIDSYSISPETLAIVREAHDILRAG